MKWNPSIYRHTRWHFPQNSTFSQSVSQSLYFISFTFVLFHRIFIFPLIDSFKSQLAKSLLIFIINIYAMYSFMRASNANYLKAKNDLKYCKYSKTLNQNVFNAVQLSSELSIKVSRQLILYRKRTIMSWHKISFKGALLPYRWHSKKTRLFTICY